MEFLNHLIAIPFQGIKQTQLRMIAGRRSLGPGIDFLQPLFKNKDLNSPVEYSRVLMSGVKIDVITSAFYYLENIMMIIPYIEGDPNNVMQFAHNWDMGQFVANYTPVDNNQVNRRVFMNTREWPIVTCPIGAIVHVQNLENKFPDLRRARNDVSTMLRRAA